jgi:hypothetical protein
MIGCGWDGIDSIYVLSKSSWGCMGVVLKVVIILFLGFEKLFDGLKKLLDCLKKLLDC